MILDWGGEGYIDESSNLYSFIFQKCYGKCEVMLHILTGVTLIALVGSLVRCVILTTLTRQKSRDNFDNSTSLAFDLIHSFIQGIHVIEYIALLYGIAGFYLYAVINKKNLHKLNDAYKKSFECRHYTHIGVIVLCGLGLMIFMLATFVPIGILTKWPYIIAASRNITENTTMADLPSYTASYVGIAYISHACHSFTRIFMICVTMVVRSAWLSQTQPKQRVDNSNYSLIACAKFILRPKWLENPLEEFGTENLKKNSKAKLKDGSTESKLEDKVEVKDLKDMFMTLIDNYNATGQLVAPLHGIFQQWFVLQWMVYFIKIIEDFTVVINSLVSNDNKVTGPKLLFVTTHLVYDLILFLIPYYCASLMNQYHDEYHKRLQRAQNSVLCNDNEGWRLQCALLIPENPKYKFVPSFCGLSIPLSSPGYNLSIILALVIAIT